MRALAALAVPVVLAIAAAGCGPTAIGPTPSSSPGPSSPSPSAVSPAASPGIDRVAGWRSDFEAIVAGLDRLHPPSYDRDGVERFIAQVEPMIPTATDDQLMVLALRTVAMANPLGCDGHTGIFVWGTGSYPVDSLPLRLWLFHDVGLVVVDALEPYRGLIGRRVATIAGHPAPELVGRVQDVVPKDNGQTVATLLPRYALIPQVLRGLGLAGTGPIQLETAGDDGTTTATSVDPIPMAAYNAWAGPYGLHLPADPDVLYLSRMDDVLWWQTLPDDPATLFVQYNRVENVFDQVARLEAAIDDPGTERVVFDVRHNYGGEINDVDVMVDVVRAAVSRHPGNVYLVTGRNTFSAASLFVARVAATHDVSILGEGMGGCPQGFGNSRDVDLPFSGLVMSVATDRYGTRPGENPEPDTIQPDTPTPLSLEDWASGTDPALAAIAGQGP
jgi:hypothetical protein